MGCILYRLLSGRDPFESEYQQELFKQITETEVTFSGPSWQNTSKFGQDLVKSLLIKDQVRRPNIVDVAKHFWFKGDELILDLVSPTESTLKREVQPLLISNEIKRFTFELEETPKTGESVNKQEMQLFYTPQKSPDIRRKWSLGISDTASSFLTEKRVRKLSYFAQVNHDLN